MPTDKEKAQAFLDRVLGPDPQAFWNKGLRIASATGGADTELGAGSLGKLSGKTAKPTVHDAFKGLAADHPVRALSQSLDRLHEVAQQANQAGLWRQVENFIAPLISDTHDVVNSYMSQGKPLRLSNESAFPGKMSTPLAGRATPQQVSEAHGVVNNAIDALTEMMKVKGHVVPPKPTGSAAEFLENRLREEAETPKQTKAPKAPKMVNDPYDEEAINAALKKLMGD